MERLFINVKFFLLNNDLQFLSLSILFLYGMAINAIKKIDIQFFKLFRCVLMHESIRRIFDGILLFRKLKRPAMVKEFERVRDHPDPRAVLFTCMDSRWKIRFKLSMFKNVDFTKYQQSFIFAKCSTKISKCPFL